MSKFTKDNQPEQRRDPEPGGQANADRHLLTNALRLALQREVKDAEGKPTRRLNVIAEKLAAEAETGNMPAIKEVFDRTEGKPNQSIDQTLSNPDGTPVIMWGAQCPPKSK